MKILIIRVSAIGDVIHTLPAIMYLKQQLPHAQITWVVQKKAASLLYNQPFIDNLVVLPDNFLKPKNLKQTWSLIKPLTKINWNAIIDFQGLLKTSLIISQLTGKKFGFSKKHTRERITTWFTNHHTTPEYTNIIQKNLALMSQVVTKLTPTKTCPTIESLQPAFALHATKEQIAIVDIWLQKNKLNHFITLAPNTTWKSKHWPLEHWKELLVLLKNIPSSLTRRPFETISTKSLKASGEKKVLFTSPINKRYKVILLGKDFGDQAEKLAVYIKQNNLPIILAPKWNLVTTSYFLQKTALLIAPDTGILHLGDFLGTQTIALFGPTLAKRHGPFLKKENITHAIQVHCPHCYQKEHGAIDCMATLSPQQLFKNILHTLHP